MIFGVKTISTEIDNLTRRVIKFLRFGRGDVQTSLQVSPYGVDSNPIKDFTAIYAETGEKGKTVIIGYINRNQLAEVGEYRIFSTDASGNMQTYIWLKNDGTMQIGGDVDNMVRYAALNMELQNFKSAIQSELTKIATGITGAGGSYTPGTLNLDLSSARIDEIKTQ